jgi:hypothetical protein
MSRKALYVLLSLILAAGIAAARCFALFTSSASAKYEKLKAGITPEEAQAALGDSGTDSHPGGTTGVYLIDRSFSFSPDSLQQKEHYWKFSDGMIIASFGSDGKIAEKTFLRR